MLVSAKSFVEFLIFVNKIIYFRAIKLPMAFGHQAGVTRSPKRGVLFGTLVKSRILGVESSSSRKELRGAEKINEFSFGERKKMIYFRKRILSGL